MDESLEISKIEHALIPVETPDQDEATELQEELTPRLSDDKSRELASLIISEYHACIQDRSEWESRLAEWESAYYNETVEKTFPWEGACNFHVPITMTSVETLKPRLVDGVLGETPPIIVVPTRGSDEEKKDKVETFLNWQVLNEMKIEPIVTQSAHLFLQPGLAVAKVYWKVDRKKRKQIREYPISTTIQDIFEDLFGVTKPNDLVNEGGLKWTGTLPTSPQGGPPLEVSLQLKYIDNKTNQSVQVLVSREEVIEGPHIDMVDPIDLIVPVKGGHQIDELPYAKQRLWMTEDDLRIKAKLNRFYPDVVEKLLLSGAHKGDQPTTDSQAYRAGQDATEGVEGQGPSNAKQFEYEVLEDYRRQDIDGDGFDEEIIVWVAVDCPDDILGWDYLDNVYSHGRRPLRVGRYFPIPFRFYGLPVAEVIRGIQDEINTIHQQRVDYGTIQNMPFGFKKASATMPPISQALRPGVFIDVDNPKQDIEIPKWQGTASWGQSEEAVLQQTLERLLGISDLSMGRQPNRVGATRTAKGTQTLLGESGLRFKIALQEFQRFWAGIFSDILALDQEYLPAGKEFRVTGKRPTVVRLKDRTEIQGRFDLRIASSAESMNRGQVREDATVVVQAIMNPAVLQGGLVSSKGIRRAYSDFLKAYGRDPDFYLEDQAPVRSPKEELMYFVGGQYIAPAPGEQIDVHLKEHFASLQDPVVPKEAKKLIQRHIQETMELKRVQSMAQTMQQRPGSPNAQGPIGPQAQNALSGAAQPQNGGQTNNTAGLPMRMGQ
jgi:hypothetical protein